MREADLEHALNLLVNNAVEWFGSFTDTDQTVHRFGEGVAMNVHIENEIHAIAAGRSTEHRIIMFWKTEFLRPGEELRSDTAAEPEEDTGKHQCFDDL